MNKRYSLSQIGSLEAIYRHLHLFLGCFLSEIDMPALDSEPFLLGVAREISAWTRL